jgi:hypothetical protein
MASSETQVPSFDMLMWPTICALKQMGGSASHDELLDKGDRYSYRDRLIGRNLHER